MPDAYNKKRLESGKITPSHVTELTRFWQKSHSLPVDGKLGPKTAATLGTKEPVDWPVFQGPLEKIPRNRGEIYQIFGNPGVGKPDKRWVKENIVAVRDLPGVPAKWYFQCHRLAEPYLREGLRRASLSSDYVIEKAASWVFRHMRHDPSLPLSTHAFGIAIDIDPSRNGAKSYSRGKAPKAWSDEYNNTWPDGLPKSFVKAMQSVGFTWGSDWDNDGFTHDHTFLDPMHFELVARK